MQRATLAGVCGRCLFALCAALTAPAALAIADDGVAAATPTATSTLGVGLYRGRPVTFEIVNG